VWDVRRDNDGVAPAHHPFLARDLELEFALDDERDLLLVVPVNGSLGIRLEVDEVRHDLVAEDRLEGQAGNDLERVLGIPLDPVAFTLLLGVGLGGEIAVAVRHAGLLEGLRLVEWLRPQVSVAAARRVVDTTWT
jgi:hypothetical protein